MSWRERATPVVAETSSESPKTSWRDRAVTVEPKIGKIESGLTGAFSGATAGFMDEITGATEALANMVGVKNTHDLTKMELDTPDFDVIENYRKGRDAKRAMQDAAQEANPKSYMAGQFAGAAATSALPVVGGTSISNLAAQGAAQGLGDSRADLTEGDVLGAVKDTSIGAGLGVGAGLAGKAISAVGSKAMPYVQKSADAISDFGKSGAEKLALNATGATGKQASEFAPGAGRELLDSGMVSFWDDAGNIAEKVGAAKDKAGKYLGTALEELDNQGVTASMDNVVNSLEAQIKELAQSPGNERLIKQIQGEIDNLYMRGQSNVPVSLGEQAKRNYQGMVNWNSPELDRKMASRVSDAFKNEVEQAATAANPEIGAAFKEAKKTYGLLKPIEEAAERRAAVNSQSPFGGFGDVVTAGLGAATGGIGGAVSGILGKRVIQPRLASSGAVIADNIADIVKNSPQKLGKFAKTLQDAASRGGTSLAATHYVLQQQDPEYRKLVNTNEESSEEEGI